MNEVTSLEVTVLMENHAVRPDLKAEHGLSMAIRYRKRAILFDCGQTDACVDNARELGVKLDRFDTIVLSHGHYDHTGGLPALRELAPAAITMGHPDVVLSRYSIRDPLQPKPIGIPPASLEVLQSGYFRPTLRPTRLLPDLWVSGEIPRKSDYEDVGGPFFRDAEGRVPDMIRDDQALCFQSKLGLVIILGCAHAGIINTILHCQRITGVVRVHALIGGFHLVQADENRLKQTIDALRYISPDVIAACHCTGTTATDQLKEAFPRQFRDCGAGSRFMFPAQ